MHLCQVVSDSAKHCTVRVVESQSEREYALIEEMLCGAGFEHYEVSNYAKAGRRSRHNSSYWHQAEYLGIGPGAHSFNGVERHWSEQSLGEYIARREYVSEILTEQDFRNECVMSSLRCAEGIDMEYFIQRFGAKKAAELRSMASRWIASGDVVDNGERIYIPTSRFLISDAVIESLFEV
jgi:oxygen-independent coproporphyrinogen-3 oxidase